MVSRRLSNLPFEYTALESLPVDQNEQRQVREAVPGKVFSLVDLQPLKEPRLVCASESAFSLLGVSLGPNGDPEFLSASLALPQTKFAYAHCYCGYQFGYFAGQLGDGAATSIGEVVAVDGQRMELQFKGAGLTPYSRAGDGRKVLRSSVREFLASEAMHHLGIPTTRAASVCTSESRVTRDPAYTGNTVEEPCAVVLRVAPSFMRFGSFEICKPKEHSNTPRFGPSADNPDLVPALLNYIIFHHFQDLWAAAGGGVNLQSPPPSEDVPQMYLSFYRAVIDKTASLVALWQSVGFCHGVLNTDNMSVLGLTLDYGPFGFLDSYDEEHVCNSSDDTGRYAFGRQPAVVEWNIQQLGEMLKLVGLLSSQVNEEHKQFYDTYENHFHRIMRRKLGLLKVQRFGEDRDLVAGLLKCMQDTAVDFTVTFRSLALVKMPTGSTEVDMTGAGPSGEAASESPCQAFLDAVLPTALQPKQIADKMRSTIDPQQLKLLEMLATRDPNTLLGLGLSRKEIIEEVKKNEQADAMLAKDPAEKATADQTAWKAWLSLYRERLQAEVAAGATEELRQEAMNGANPKIVLRNWVAQVAIDAATRGDFDLVKRILGLLEQPYKDYSRDELLLPVEKGQWTVDQPPPPSLSSLCVSCSS